MTKLYQDYCRFKSRARTWLIRAYWLFKPEGAHETSKQEFRYQLGEPRPERIPPKTYEFYNIPRDRVHNRGGDTGPGQPIDPSTDGPVEL